MIHHYNLGLAFEAVVTQHAPRAALRLPGQVLSYAEILDLAERLGAMLLARGCRQGDVVAIGMNKGPLHYAVMLAALRLGMACVNLDPASPLARNKHIMTIAQPRLLFVENGPYQEAMEALAQACGTPALLSDALVLPSLSDTDRMRQQALIARVDGATIAYVMFTSGSTGIPKGVAVTHDNVLHFIQWGQSRLAISPDDNFANISPLYFDNSVFDFFIALFSGASLTPVERGLLTQPYKLVEHVAALGCTIWFSVPSLLIYLVAMKAMSATALPALRLIVFGGEGYPKSELRKLFDRFRTQAELVNVYGPTECTCICSAHTIGEADFEDMSGLPMLGQLNPNFDYRILSDTDEDADTGELCLIGPNVAAGYFNDLERSAASFFALTSADRFMKRMYRTGDIVRESEGNLYFVGRKDNQIKHMGYRIELEEIEMALARLDEVTQVAVVYHRKDAAYGKLIGFIATDSQVEEKDLLQRLAGLVPDYMLPSRLILMAELPKNPNGKVDKLALKASLDG